MDPITAFTGKIEDLVRPGAHGNTMADGRAMLGPGVAAQGGVYVTWSGTGATVHRRILFGIASHGIGAELA